MRMDDAGAKTRPPQPVLFAAVGQTAVATVAQLPQAARDLGVRIAGPFGMVMMNTCDGEVLMSDCDWLSDVGTSVDQNRSGGAEYPDDALLSQFTSLVRRLRVENSNVTPNGSPVLRVCAYVVMDLSVPGVVAPTIRITRLLRQADPSLDITGLALTGRTAKSQFGSAELWFETFKELLEKLKNVNLLQRLYVLDGRDANNTWLQTIESMHRVGAQFLLHHGLSPYRSHLRRRERNRVDSRDNFLDYCGSVACRTLSCDREAVAQGVAAELAKDLVGLDQDRTLPDDRGEKLEELARELAEDLAGIYKKDGKTLPEQQSTTPAGQSQTNDEERDKQVRDLIRNTVQEVCTEQPVLSLRWFLRAFRPILNKSITRNRFSDRINARRNAADWLKKQEDDTYTPIKVWSGLPGARFRTRFEPYLDQTPRATVSCPVDKRYYYFGVGIMGLGLLGVAVWGFLPYSAAAVSGGLVAIWASALTVLPTKWKSCERTVVTDEGKKPSSIRYCHYRKNVPSANLWVSTMLLGLGVLGTGGVILQAGAMDGITSLWVLRALCSVLLIAGGFACLYQAEVKAHWPRGVPRQDEAPDLAVPLNWRWHILALLCLTAAWLLICIEVYQPPISYAVMKVLSLILVLAGVAVGRWPQVGQAQLTYPTPRKPEPLEPSVRKWREESELDRQIERIGTWVENLLAAPEPAGLGASEWPESQPRGTVLEAIVEHWHRRLADVFRKSLQETPEKSLTEMAKNPHKWAECLDKELDDPTVGLANPAYLFAYREVGPWLENMSWHQIISELNPDPQWFDFFVTRSVPPRWSQPRRDPEVDASVITVGKELWKILASLAQASTSHRLKVVDWQEPYTLVAVRIVQGLRNGWLNYPGIPGQVSAGAGKGAD